MRGEVVPVYYRLSNIIYIAEYIKDSVSVPGKFEIIIAYSNGEKTADKQHDESHNTFSRIVNDIDVNIFMERGFIPITTKSDTFRKKVFVNPSRIKYVREYVGSAPVRWYICMDDINEHMNKPYAERKAQPYTFITTTNIIPLLMQL